MEHETGRLKLSIDVYRTQKKIVHGRKEMLETADDGASTSEHIRRDSFQRVW